MSLFRCQVADPADHTAAVVGAIVEAPTRTEAAAAFDSVYGRSGLPRTCQPVARGGGLRAIIRVLRDGSLFIL